jgi:hypothetical protein
VLIVHDTVSAAASAEGIITGSSSKADIGDYTIKISPQQSKSIPDSEPFQLLDIQLKRTALDVSASTVYDAISGSDGVTDFSTKTYA